MASVITIEDMQDAGLHKLCERLCRDILGTSRDDGTSLQFLLPIKLIYNPYPTYGSIKFTHPDSKKEFEEKYSDEDGRVKAINKINKEIKAYNNWLKEYEQELDNKIGLEERVRHRLSERPIKTASHVHKLLLH
jgi:hypothetical protein